MDNNIGCLAHQTSAGAISHLLSIKQLAESAGLSRKFISRQIKAGKVPCIRLSHRCVRVERQDWERYLSDRKAGAA